MPENTLLRYFFSSGSEVDPEDRFHLNRKTRTRRLKEISDILRKHHFLKGFTPEAFRAMLEDLGPSFVKIGQTLSTRSEILPKAYCDELAKLQMECDPLPFEAILEALDDIYGDAQGDVFDAIDPTPLGSASLAQVHKARLVTGEIVAVKIQRPGVKTTMAQDIDIMRMVARYAARFMKDEQMLDLRDVVEELWATFLEETDFQREAANLEEFARLNKGVAFIDCPKVHTELCGEYVLVMEYIDGIPILATDRLRKAGYDLEEIGEKILDNYASITGSSMPTRIRATFSFAAARSSTSTSASWVVCRRAIAPDSAISSRRLAWRARPSSRMRYCPLPSRRTIRLSTIRAFWLTSTCY